MIRYQTTGRVLALALFFVGAAAATEGPILKLGTSVVDVTDVDAAMLGLPPEQWHQQMADQGRVGRMLERIGLRRAVVEQAEVTRYVAPAERDRIWGQTLYIALGKRYLNHLLDQLPEPDVDALARDLYAESPEQFEAPETVTVTHLLVGTERRTDEEAQQRATELLQQVKADPSQFEQLIIDHSDDPGKSRNQGVYIDFPRGQMVKPFEQQAFSMTEVGQFSDPVHTQFGYHILRFDGRKSARQLAFDEVREPLEKSARSKYIREQREKILARHDNDGATLGRAAEAAGFGQDSITQRALQLDAEEQLLAAYKLAFLESKRPNLEKFARERYLTTKEKSRQPERVTLQVLTLPAAAEEAAREQFIELTEQLKNSEIRSIAEIEQLVGAAIRQDVEAEPVADLFPAIGDAVAKLRESDSRFDVIEDRGHLYLLELVTLHPPGIPTFEEVREKLIAEVTADHDREIWEAHVDQFRNLPVSVDEQALLTLTDRYKDQTKLQSRIVSP